jgi:hypothetical protein
MVLNDIVKLTAGIKDIKISFDELCLAVKCSSFHIDTEGGYK